MLGYIHITTRIQQKLKFCPRAKLTSKQLNNPEESSSNSWIQFVSQESRLEEVDNQERVFDQGEDCELSVSSNWNADNTTTVEASDCSKTGCFR